MLLHVSTLCLFFCVCGEITRSGTSTCIISRGTLTTILFHSTGARGSGAQRWTLGRDHQADSRQSVGPAATRAPDRSPTCSSCSQASEDRTGLAECRLGPNTREPRCPRPLPAPPPASWAACQRGRTTAASRAGARPPARGALGGRGAPLLRFCGRVTAGILQRAACPAVSLRARTALLPAERTRRRGAGPSVRGETAGAGLCCLHPGRRGRLPLAAGKERAGRPAWFGLVFSSTRPPRYDNTGIPYFEDAVGTKMRAFCPVAWSGLPAAFVWLPDGQRQLHFSSPERGDLDSGGTYKEALSEEKELLRHGLC